MKARWYPPASKTAQRFDATYPGTSFDTLEKVTIHSTETSGWPGYDGGRVAPNFTVRPDFLHKSVLWRQHYPANMSSRALQNLAGGVQTNMDRNCQIEMIGTCDLPTARRWNGLGLTQNVDYIYFGETPTWFRDGIAKFVAWMNIEWDVPLNAPSRWLPYPQSYGANAVRMRGGSYDAFRGYLGHQHTAENDHGDPGNFPMNDVLARAERILNPPKPIEPVIDPTPLPGANDMDLAAMKAFFSEKYITVGWANGVKQSVLSLLSTAAGGASRVAVVEKKLDDLTDKMDELLAAQPAPVIQPTPAAVPKKLNES